MISNAHQQQVKNLSHFIRSLHKDYFSLPGPLSLSLSFSLSLSLSLSVSLSLPLSLSLSHFSPWFSVYFIWLLQPYTNRLLGVILRRCFLVSLTTLKKTFFCQQVLVDASLTSGATTFAMTTLNVMTLSMTEK